MLFRKTLITVEELKAAGTREPPSSST